MGSGSSVQDTRHSRLFQEGFKALQEGRYTYAEIYYDQAIERHEGHGFWSLFDDLIDKEKKTKTERKKEDGKEKNDASGDADGGRSHRDTSKQASEEGSEEGEGRNSEVGRGDFDSDFIEIPLDDRLEDVLEYIELRTDIANSYLEAGRFEDASPHMDFISSHTQAVIKYIKIARENAAADDEELDPVNPFDSNVMGSGENALAGNTAPGHRRGRMGMLVGSDVEQDTILDCMEQHLRLHWVSSQANSVYILLERYKGTQGDKKRKKELDGAVVTCLKVLEELNVVARRRAKSLTNAVVLGFLEGLIEEMDADSSSTSVTDTRNNSSRLDARSNAPERNQSNNNDNAEGNDGKDPNSIRVRLQKVQERRSLCHSVPAPQQGASLRYISWLDDDIHRVIPGTNYHLEIQCGMVDEKRKKQLQKRSMKFVAHKRFDFNDRVLLGKCFDEENALLLFPVLLIQADVQLELGAATKGIQALDLVDKLATQLYGVDSVERVSLMRRVMESRRRGGALFMMFED